MVEKPSLVARAKPPTRRRLAAIVCFFRGYHNLIELEKGFVEIVEGQPRQVFKRNKIVCRDCNFSFGIDQ
jgi:hypothetical protein